MIGGMRKALHKVFVLLFGDTDRFTLEHRLFNAACLLSSLTGISNSIVNFAFVETPILVVSTGIFGVVIFFFYLTSRARLRYKTLVRPGLFLILLTLATQWFWNGGTKGGAQYFFFIGAMITLLLTKQKNRFLVAAGYLSITGLFIFIEYMKPEWVVDYESRDARYIDITYSMLLGILLIMITVFLVSHNYNSIFKKLQEYRELFYEDILLARILQRRIFEMDPSLKTEFDLDLRYNPSLELSGDVYDLKKMESGLRVFLADAKGHGVNASLSAMLIKSEWAHLNNQNISPGYGLTILNSLLYERYGDSVSCTAVVADICEDMIVFSSAGHIQQLLIQDTVITDLEATGPPLGIVAEAEYPEKKIPISGHGRLYLFTDALYEEPDKEGILVGSDWLKDTIGSLNSSSEAACEQIINTLALLKGQKPRGLICIDDLTLIAIGLGKKAQN